MKMVLNIEKERVFTLHPTLTNKISHSLRHMSKVLKLWHFKSVQRRCGNSLHLFQVHFRPHAKNHYSRVVTFEFISKLHSIIV